MERETPTQHALQGSYSLAMSGPAMATAVPEKQFLVKIPPGHGAGNVFTVSIAGMVTLQAKPIFFGAVSHSFTTGRQAAAQQNKNMGRLVGRLMQVAQEDVLEQTVLSGCNVVLGIQFNVTNDSSGDHGTFKNVIVTCCGTPCVVKPQSSTDIPIIEATAMMAEPLHFG